MNSAQVFSSIYKDNVWSTGSGSGSLPENTRQYNDFLSSFLQTNNVKRVVDLGCGDWQSSSLMNWTGIDYTGVEVVDKLVDSNNQRYGSKNIRFKKLDVLENLQSLPDGELLIVKDVLQHWPTRAIIDFGPAIRKYKYALITNTVRLENLPADYAPDSTIAKVVAATQKDIQLGHFRALNLRGEPFNFTHLKSVLTYNSPRVKSSFGMEGVVDVKEVLLLSRDSICPMESFV